MFGTIRLPGPAGVGATSQTLRKGALVTRPITRRRFLRTGAVATAAVALPGVLSSRSPNERLNIGGIGVGGKGYTDIRMCRSENIVALCDVDEIRLAHAAKVFPKAERYVDYRRLLERKDVDAVTVSTPDHHHAPASLMAMQLGKHVYCQKPLTHSVAEARAMAEAARRSGVATQMGNQGHSSERMFRVIEAVRSGVIGKVREAHAWSDRPIWPQGIDRPAGSRPIPKHVHWDLWLGPAPARPYHDAYMPFKWRGFWDFGTGALGDMGCHIIDSIFWALELTAPTAVWVEGPEPHVETAPKWERVHYEFPARSEELPALRLTWHDGGKKPPPEHFGVDDPKKIPANGSLFVGEHGNIMNPRGRPVLLPREKFKDAVPPEPFLPRSPGHYKEWIEACKSGRPTGTHFGYAGALTEAVLLGNVAHRVGKRIEWDSAAMTITNVPEANQFLQRDYREGWNV